MEFSDSSPTTNINGQEAMRPVKLSGPFRLSRHPVIVRLNLPS